MTAALYNYTEASFYGMSLMWLFLLVACIDVPSAALGVTETVTVRTALVSSPWRPNRDVVVSRETDNWGIVDEQSVSAAPCER